MSLKDLPSPSAPNFLPRVREMLHTLAGKTGSARDRALTLADAIESGVIGIGPGGSLVPGPEAGEAYVPDLTPPPTPDTLTATPAISHILLEVPAATYTQGHGHLRTRVYGVTRLSGDPAPVFADAVEVGQFSGTVWAFPSNPSTTWHLWAKWESVDGVLSATPVGGTNGVVATTGQDVTSLVQAMTGPGNPFKVVTSETTLPDGSVVPPGTYTSDAYVHNGQITNAKIANLAVDDAKIANLSVSKLTAGSIAVGQYAQSTGYVAGSSGWRINGDGTAEFSGVVVRGTVYATAGLIGGITVASNAVRAGQSGFNAGTGFYLGSDGRFSVGNSSGNNIHWDGSNLNIRGTVNGSTFNGVTMNSGAINLQGDGGANWGYARSLDKWWDDGNNGWVFARQGSDGSTFAEVKGGNQRFWMSSWGDCGIQFPGITMTNGGLTINQANVIDTINLAGNAVTVPVGVSSSASVSIQSNEVTLQTAAIDAGGQPVCVFASAAFDGGRDSSATITVKLRRNGYQLTASYVWVTDTNRPNATLVFADTPGPGIHTYTLTAYASGAAGSTFALDRSMVLLGLKR